MKIAPPARAEIKKIARLRTFAAWRMNSNNADFSAVRFRGIVARLQLVRDTGKT
jgi:hypothetical protein